MYRSKDIIVASLGEVRAKIVPEHVIFFLNDRKIFYRGTKDNDLLDCINKMK
jgi:hypothetical protein